MATVKDFAEELIWGKKIDPNNPPPDPIYPGKSLSPRKEGNLTQQVFCPNRGREDAA